MSATKKPGSLHDLPILIKDNINTVGYFTTAGTPGLAKNAPLEDAEIVKRLKNAGAFVFGKANMHELAQGITSSNPAYGAVRNPYNMEMITGGSSGGNAAAVAARFTPASVGTDTGGSTRIPASLCGIVGFRPTVGRYPGTGPKPPTDDVPISRTRDTPGPMARTISDVVLLDAVMAGIDQPWEHLKKLEHQVNLSKLRLGIARGYFFNNLDHELKETVEKSLAKLQNEGVTLVEIEIPNLHELLTAANFPIVVYETGEDLPYYLKYHKTGLTLQQLRDRAAGPDVKAILDETLKGATTEATYRETVNVATPKLKNALNEASKGVDALIFPTTVLPARPINPAPPQLIDTVELNGKQVNTVTAYSANCEIASCACLSSLSVPAGIMRSGLPVGLELCGPHGADNDVLSIGLAVERILGHLPPPKLQEHIN